MAILIDGYNVLFALALIPKEVQPGDLQRARLTLLDMLHRALGEAGRGVTVVFDAAGAPPGAPGDFVRHGIEVRFAERKEEADEALERLIRAASAPQKLTVISSDLRLRQAAQRRGARSVRAEDILEWLDEMRANRRQSKPATPAPEDKPAREPNVDHWLRAFSGDACALSPAAQPLTPEDFAEGGK
jgi:predicted RNA-binding protein with PIN domain